MLFAKKIIQFAGEKSPYAPDQVIFEQATAGTYSLDILADGKYEISCVGGGAGGSATGTNGKYTKFLFGSGGGSGAGFVGIINITKGNYLITVGAGGNGATATTLVFPTAGGGGDSSVSSIVTSYGAPSHTNNQQQGPGGSAPTITGTIISQTLNTAGNNGGYSSYGGTGSLSVAGGASVYNGFGAGGGAYPTNTSPSAANGTAGYVKIVYKGK